MGLLASWLCSCLVWLREVHLSARRIQGAVGIWDQAAVVLLLILPEQAIHEKSPSKVESVDCMRSPQSNCVDGPLILEFSPRPTCGTYAENHNAWS